MITVHLRPEIERLLQEKAVRHGQSLEALLQELAEQEAYRIHSVASSAMEATSADLWISRWRSWAAGHPNSAVIADDSRESIYEGRGE